MSLVEASALASLAEFLAATPWESRDLLDVAREGPHIAARRNTELLLADAALTQAFWRIYAIVDPLELEPAQRSFAFFYSRIKSRVEEQFAVSESDSAPVARAIARYVDIEARRLGTSTKRRTIPKAYKIELVGACEEGAHCWYCGLRFSAGAIAAFLGEGISGQHAESLPLYVDFTAPRGATTNDLRIEVDHVHAHSRGGDYELTNLRLACGWCNRHKSALGVMFDAQAQPRLFMHPRKGMVTVPVPFWVVRVLGTTRRCEARGCTSTTASGPLVVAPWKNSGAMVPGNIATICREHDPLAEFRLVPRHTVR